MALLFFISLCGSSCKLSCTSNCYFTCAGKNYGPTSGCSGWCLTNCTNGCLITCGYGCGNANCSGICTNMCQCSCGHGCGPSTAMCGGQCHSSDCGKSTCLVGCTSYCLHNSCNFNCGGDETIETSSTNCNGGCTSSSCSATGRNIFYYVVLNISLKLLGVIIWVEKEKFLKNQKV